jgi:chromate transporter
MILLELFLGFLKVGLFSFGGGYIAIPLIRDTVLAHGWLTEETLSYMIGVSESTPGPIMVNLATYVGRETAGLAGAAIATFAVILPPFLILLLISAVLKTLLRRRFPQAVLSGLKAGAVGVILATGVWMTVKSLLPAPAFDPKAAAITAILAAVLFVPQFTVKKRLSPVWVILIAAGLGVLFYGVY